MLRTPWRCLAPACILFIGLLRAEPPVAVDPHSDAHCLSCHFQDKHHAVLAKEGKTPPTRIDATALAQSPHSTLACVDCHEGLNPSVTPHRERLTPVSCGTCHPDEEAQYRSSVHAIARQQGVKDAPSCTHCHGTHDIVAKNNPDSPANKRNMAQQLCASCHASLKLTRRNNLASDRFSTFADSFHGLAARGGSSTVVNCGSCHGVHTVKSHRDPSSPTHKSNLVNTCGACHPGANESFTIGEVHANAESEAASPVLYWIRYFYTGFIVLIVGSMVLHNLIDFIHKARRKLLIQKGVIHEHHVEHRLYLRMSVHERLQHAALAASFVLLVVTGFMLRYPEAWWVTTIKDLVPSAFSLRSLMHRGGGVVMLVAGAWHIGYLMLSLRGRQLFRDLLPRFNDLTDPIAVLRHNLGLSPNRPRFGRFSYIEKAEYWALIWGTLLMAVTGAILWFDNTSMGLITKLGFDVARIVHFYEAILATLAIIVWHFYFVIFNPDVYPMNLSWLTGRMSEKEMLEEHPAELERLKQAEADALSTAPRSTGETPAAETPAAPEEPKKDRPAGGA